MTPEKYCQDKTAKSGSSFYYSFLLLPENKRKAIMAVYAFCHEVDDVVDNKGEPHIKQIKLQWWRDEIKQLFNGQPQHPVTRALNPIIADFNLPEEYFQEVIDGMEMDLVNTSYDTFKSLSLYCYRAAGVVGLMAAEIFGYEDRKTLDYAISLGTAFQLTNIIRDIKEDAQRGRIYIPQEDMEKFSVKNEELLSETVPNNLKQLINFEVQRARDYYQQAYAQLPRCDRYSQSSGLIMSSIYSTILDKIEADVSSVMNSRVRLGKLHKIWLALSTLYREYRQHKHYLKRSHAR
jgi:phytoene synthase